MKEFDPSKFKDPIAKQTQWTPLKGGGSNFSTQKLHDPQNGHSIEFRASPGAIVFYLIFLLSGLGLLYIFVFKQQEIMILVIGLIFTLIGGAMLYYGLQKRVFDKQVSAYWRGNKSAANLVQLSQIHALQIISEYIKSKKRHYYSYELNLILKDGSRVNVVDHGNREQLVADAEKLSKFLSKPVWDSSI